MLPYGQQPILIGHKAARVPKSVWAERKREKYLTKPTTAYRIWYHPQLGLRPLSSVLNIHNSFEERMDTHLQEEDYWQDLDLLSYIINRVLQIRNDLQSPSSNSERFQRRNSARKIPTKELRPKDSNEGTPPERFQRRNSARKVPTKEPCPKGSNEGTLPERVQRRNSARKVPTKELRPKGSSEGTLPERFQRRNSARKVPKKELRPTENQIEIFQPSARSQVTILSELPVLWEV